MTPLLVATVVVLGAALAALGLIYARDRRRRARTMNAAVGRILFPFAGRTVSRRALDAALRLARAESATLVPVFLARVPLMMPLDSPLPRQCSEGMPLLEIIEQRGLVVGVPVDSRIARGRTYRHALREAITQERYDRVIVAGAGRQSEGFHTEDLAWLLDNAPGEVVIVRPDHDDYIRSGIDKRRSQRRGHASRSPGAEVATPGARAIGVG
ncbi:MAG: hypothetical protein QOE86_4678 [Solirubrobacteraceae bacterium]|jgi:hypothetical protein|nr:hypothetical protein [Solirubrobacteraceae bacterium]